MMAKGGVGEHCRDHTELMVNVGVLAESVRQLTTTLGDMREWMEKTDERTAKNTVGIAVQRAWASALGFAAGVGGAVVLNVLPIFLRRGVGG